MRIRALIRLLPILLAAVLLPACVTKGEHEKALADAAGRLKAAQQQAAQQLAAAQAQIEQLNGQIATLGAQIRDQEAKLGVAATNAADLQKKLDDASAVGEKLRAELEKLGKNVDKLLKEKGSLNASLSDTKKRLEELRKAQAAAQKRADLFRQLALKFKKMVDAGNLQVVLRNGRMVLLLRNDVLFASSQIKVKKAGQDALREVAGVLVTLKDRRLQVAGHTDNVPIMTGQFPSNWELSADRAIAVVKLLVKEGVDPKLISAAGYSEYDPVAPNDTPEGKAKNRRIEIVLQPNIGELVNIPTG